MLVGFSSREFRGTETAGVAIVCVRVLNPEFGGAIRPLSISLLPEEGILWNKKFFALFQTIASLPYI